jgi:hypothetical protein
VFDADKDERKAAVVAEQEKGEERETKEGGEKRGK